MEVHGQELALFDDESDGVVCADSPARSTVSSPTRSISTVKGAAHDSTGGRRGCAARLLGIVGLGVGVYLSVSASARAVLGGARLLRLRAPDARGA